MILPQITVRPEKRYGKRGQYVRGARRSDGPQGRTFALFDTLGVRKRPISMHVRLSDKAYKALVERAVRENVSICGLGAYLIEAALRKDDA